MSTLWKQAEYFLCPHIPPSTYTGLAPTPANKAVFTVSVMLPFPEGDVVGITLRVTFSGWLLSWAHRHLSFLWVFLGLLARFLFVLRVRPSSAWTRLLIYSSSAGHLGCF